MSSKYIEAEITTILRKVRKGSYHTRKHHHYLLKKIAQDIGIINNSITHLSSLEKKDYLKLIKLWEKRGNSLLTIRRKIDAIRFFMNHAHLEAPTHAELGLPYKDNVKKITQIIDPNQITSSLIQSICLLQYYFGLKRNEGILFSPTWMQDNVLYIPRGIAYNKQDRYVPIVLSQQKECLSKLSQDFPQGFINHHWTKPLLSINHQAELAQLGIKDADYFRHLFILRHYEYLQGNLNLPRKECLRQMRRLLGYYDNRQIKEILLCPLAS